MSGSALPGPRVYILCGLAFAGKTTLARRIADATGAKIVSVDEINARRSLAGGLGIPRREWALTHEIALAALDRALEEGESAVVDDTCCFRFLRDGYRRVARKRSVESVLIQIDTPYEVALTRLRENVDRPTRPHVTEEILQQLADSFEWPTTSEKPRRFATAEAQELWLLELAAAWRPPPLPSA